ncbi:MAG: IS110 family transposase [Candidatus Limnocylindria bacterium]
MVPPKLTVGRDLGDRSTALCALDAQGEVVATERLRTTPAALERHFTALPHGRIVLEVGTHSPWVSRLLERLGHEVLVANARQLRLIYGSDRKSDRVDAETLARLGRLDPALLKPIRHRGAEAQGDLAQLRARDALVRTRTLLINHVRGAVKAWGARLPASSAPAFVGKVAPSVPPELRSALEPLLDLITALTPAIRGMERQLERVAPERYPETARLRQPSGVGLLTALGYGLTLEDPRRFRQSRAVGPYLGLCPRRDQSGERDAQWRITKRGDAMLRRLLVSGAQYILGPFGPDTDLRRWGLRLAARGGKNAKKRAVVAVARKLATLLHRLWVSGAVYQPLRAAA